MRLKFGGGGNMCVYVWEGVSSIQNNCAVCYVPKVVVRIVSNLLKSKPKNPHFEMRRRRSVGRSEEQEGRRRVKWKERKKERKKRRKEN